VTPFERLLKIMIKPYVLMSYLALIILSILYADRPIAYYFHAFNFHWGLPFLKGLTLFGASIFYIGPLFILALYFRYVHVNKVWEKRSWFLWLCVFIPNSICLLLKIGIGRARPDLLFKEHLYGFYGFKTHAPYWSFPSGHTTTVMGLMFGLCILFPRYSYAYLLFGVLVVITRVMLTHHYLSDVLTAGYLTLIEVGLLYYWLKSKNRLLDKQVLKH